MRAVNRLTATAVRQIKAAGYHPDGAGVYLQVGASGSKSWVFQYTLRGKRREMGLGSAAVLSLGEARTKAHECRRLLLDGIDPIEHRQAQRESLKLAAAKSMTFKEAAERCIEDRRAEWSNAKHAQQWENTLSTYAYPHIGSLAVAAIDTGLVRACLDPIWTTKTETASRLRQRIEAVLDWAKVHGYRSGDNPAAWRGHLEAVMARPTKVAKAENHAALPYAQLPAFIKELRKHEGTAAAALEFTILTAARTSETILATPAEFDLKAKTWTIPAERMKAKVEHTVPLSARAVSVVKRMLKNAGPYVFPGARDGKPLSNMAMLELVRGMGTRDATGEPVTVHGFRSTFRQWAAEQTTFPREVAEHALAHRLPDKVEAAYQRGTMVEKRRALMDEWAKFAN